MTQLDRIEAMLRTILSQQAQTYAPTYTPTVEDEIHAVAAQGRSIAEWAKQRAKQRHSKGAKR